MADMKDVVKLAVDAYTGRVEKYSVTQSQEAIREAIIEANNGSTVMNYRDIRDGKCNGLFALLEEILSQTVPMGLENDAWFNSVVDFRNVAAGDQNLFVTDGGELFAVADAADGTQGIRRQRLDNQEFIIPTSFKMVRIYEELNRVMAGRVDFNVLIQKVAASHRQHINQEVRKLWESVTKEQLGGAEYFPVAGAYDEDALLDLIAHVESAAGGRTATIIGTKKALRNLKMTETADVAKRDIYNMGYIGKFYGNPVVGINQMYKPGTHDFASNDNALTIIAGEDKPVKVVYEGDSLIIPGDPMMNADLTQEYLYGDKYGAGLVLAANTGVGRYVMA
jgi:hypothetical protein